MKKSLFAIAAAAGLFCAGCTTIESTQQFNGLSCGTDAEKATNLTVVKVPYYYFFGLPIVGGGLGDSQLSWFSYVQSADNMVWMLTKASKECGATRLINMQVNYSESSAFFLFTKGIMTASGTGVRSRSAAVRQARESYDRVP